MITPVQCDQIVPLFFNSWLFRAMKICQILKSCSRNGQKLIKILPKWRNFAKSGHTAPIGLPLRNAKKP